MLKHCILALAWVVVPLAAPAATLQELKKYDLNGDDRLQSGAELRHYERDLIKAAPRGLKDEKLRGYIGFLRHESQRLAREGGIPLKALAENEPRVADNCALQRTFYLRNDRIDVTIDTDTLRAAKGASLSITNDRLTGTQTAQIDGVVGYLIRNPCVHRPPGVDSRKSYLSAYAVSPSLTAHGKLNGAAKSEKSELRFGLDGQFEIFSGPIFDSQYFTVSPYYQTDFRGLASAYGVNVLWEPYLLAARLGGSFQRFSPMLDFFWKLQAEVDVLHVSKAGLTDLTAGTDYAWLGGTARAYVYLLPELLNERLVLTGTFRAFWDERSRRSIWLASAAIAYDLSDDGSAAVSFEYTKGTDKDTLRDLDQYVAKLSLKF
jgi:hypothetical protein